MTILERSSDESPTRPGQLGKYRLLELIGSGAMGDVYRAEHVLIERKVAIKIMHRELARHEELVERFFCEARAVNLIAHPHVLEISDFAREPDGTVWSVMELLEGEDLASLIRRESIELPRALTLARQLCAALAATHAAGVLHRDVKPENVFVLRRGGADFLKLIDFGIAHLPDGPSSHESGVVMGSPPYMAPEQARGLSADERTDVYAVGAVLYELITGRPLFEQSTVEALLADVVQASPPLPSTRVQLPESVADALDHLLVRCLAKDKRCRPDSALALDAELAAIADQLQRAAHEPDAGSAVYAPLSRPAHERTVDRERPKWAMRAACGVAALLGASASAALTGPTPGAQLAPMVAPARAEAQSPAVPRSAPVTTSGKLVAPATPATPAVERAAAAAAAGRDEEAKHDAAPRDDSDRAYLSDSVRDDDRNRVRDRERGRDRVHDPDRNREPDRTPIRERERMAVRDVTVVRSATDERGMEQAALDPDKLLDPFHAE